MIIQFYIQNKLIIYKQAKTYIIYDKKFNLSEEALINESFELSLHRNYELRLI